MLGFYEDVDDFIGQCQKMTLGIRFILGNTVDAVCEIDGEGINADEA